MVLLRTVSILIGLAVALAAKSAPAETFGLIIDREGRIYFADDTRQGGCVWRFDLKGGGEPTPADKGRVTHGLALGPDGACYGLSRGKDGFSGSLWKVGEPQVVGKFTLPPSRGQRFALNWDEFALGENKEIYLRYDYQVWVSEPNRPIRSIAGLGWGDDDGRGSKASFMLPGGGLTWGSDGALYLPDHRKLRRVDREGNVATKARGLLDLEAGEPGFATAQGPSGPAFDAAGTFYFADGGGRRVRKVTPDGKAKTVHRSERPWHPTAVATREGTIYFLEWKTYQPLEADSVRVKAIASDGTVAVVVSIDGEKKTLPKRR